MKCMYILMSILLKLASQGLASFMKIGGKMQSFLWLFLFKVVARAEILLRDFFQTPGNYYV